VQVTGRFSPHPRGFGFLDLDVPATLAGLDGRTHQIDSLFVPPDVAKGWIADDVVVAEVEADDQDRFNATSLTLQARQRKFVVGRVGSFVGRTILELDPRMGAGHIATSEALGQRVMRAVGQQIVATLESDADGKPSAGALVAGPTPSSAPLAMRAKAVIVAHGAAAPELVPGGAAAVGLSPAETKGFALRAQGRMAAGGSGLAAGLDTLEGPVPGLEMELDNLRHELAVTIDGDSSRDLDDALVAAWDGDDEKPVHLTVHISDVAGTVGIGSEADRYARTMATSAYFVAGENVPMLDPALSEGELSLLPHEARRVLSVTMDVAPDGAVTNVVLHGSWIDSHARLNYAAVDAFLVDHDASHLLVGAHGPNGAASGLIEATTATVTALAEASRRLGVDRDGRETMETLFEDALLEAAVVDGKIRTTHADPHPAAQQLVERLMVAANEAVANWAVERDLPLLFRGHIGFDPERRARLDAALTSVGEELPTAEGELMPEPGDLLRLVNRLREEGRDEHAATIATVATGIFARATYEGEPSGHGGLGSGAYTHFTSPIRRYADLVVHRQLRASLAGETPPYTTEDLKALGPWLDARSGAANRAQAIERSSLWGILLERGAVKWPSEAIITRVASAGLSVRLPEAGVTGFISAARATGGQPRDRAKLELNEHELETRDGKFRVGQRIKVRLDRIDELGRPDFMPA
jgi:ribonuclease R